MSNDAFDVQLLFEKLSKLNNSQQSIESVSRWCISHRDKARKITETWEKLFNTRQKEQRVSFLFLANDILQNSRRLGNEFVSEFWKVLPSSLKQVYDNGDEQGRSTVTRLVTIWEQRKVFGSRGPGLKDELLGKSQLPPLPTNGKPSNVVKVVKKDTQSVRIKLAVGSFPEKIVSAFQSVLDEEPNEERDLSSLNSSIAHADKLRIEAEGNPHASNMMRELEEEEHHLLKCIEKVEQSEAFRNQLILQLKEAIKDQETKMSSMQSQLQIARGHVDKLSNLRKRASSGFVLSEEESKKAAAAAVAAKLTACTSSAQMLTSVLSSLVAEEAASFGHFPADKRQKMEKPMMAPAVSYSAPSQYVSVGMMGYGYGGNPLPPPPPLPPHVAPMGIGRVGAPPQPAVVPPQQKASSGFYRPPGIGFYGPAPPPPVQR